MKVTLLSSTENGIDNLIMAKSTRLRMCPEGFDRIRSMPYEEKIKEIEYISKTIRSSWEHMNMTFLIEGVSRAFTHQWVRNRHCSHSQQTMRMLDVSDFGYITGPSFEGNPEATELYHDTMAIINSHYQQLLEMDIPEEDARGILPTNICTNIVTTMNLRTLADLCASRSSPRTQAEFRDVMDEVRNVAIKKHPWTEIMLCSGNMKAALRLYNIIKSDYKGTDKYLPYIKLIDQLRN